MKYKFILTHQATDSIFSTQRECHPVYNDDLSVSIERENDEWYYKRTLDGNIIFRAGDYSWIMSQAFDGIFTMNIQCSTNGIDWNSYFTGSFSRANLEIDEDNHTATLTGFIDNAYSALEEGEDEEYDLMKLIPDSEAKEVQGTVPPALAIIDECSEVSKPTTSDIFAGAALTSGGYNTDTDLFWASNKNMESHSLMYLHTIIAEAKVSEGIYAGTYSGVVSYTTLTKQWEDSMGRTYTVRVTSPAGILNNKDNDKFLRFGLHYNDNVLNREAYVRFYLDNTYIAQYQITNMYVDNPYYSPMSYNINNGFIQIKFHYIFTSLLTQKGPNVLGSTINNNFLDTSSYYKGIKRFTDVDNLTIFPSVQTVEQPNGHRLVSGTGEQGTTPQYYAPPNNSDTWIPVNESSWDFASIWYKITPTISNGLLDTNNYGSFRWTRCWTIGTCIRYLVNKITNGKVLFSESELSSQFLYGNPCPVADQEPFTFLVTQKSNVMRPSNGGESAARCPVRLQWFFELLRNAFNCYYWLQPQNDGTYLLRIEHVNYLRNGGSYGGTLTHQLNLTQLFTRRNLFRRNEPVKRLSDLTNKYTYDTNQMVQKYTFSWQGDGGSDDFKGNPMFFKAGWVSEGSSEDHQVDNIFADLSWLMLNAGSDTASSKNYDGIFLFAGYQKYNAVGWTENSRPISRFPSLSSGRNIVFIGDIWLTIPEGQTVNVYLRNLNTMTDTLQSSVIGTGHPQLLRIITDVVFISDNQNLFIDFGTQWQQIILHRVHYNNENINVFNVPNTENLLSLGNYLQNGPLSWPSLQCAYLHYDIPAKRWSYNSDDIDQAQWQTDGTVKLIKRQSVGVVPFPTSDPDTSRGIKTAQPGIGIIKSAKINLGTRNTEIELLYDPTVNQ